MPRLTRPTPDTALRACRDLLAGLVADLVAGPTPRDTAGV